jgi:putative tricarboxylic transport membrane protein
MVAVDPLTMVVHNDSPYKTAKDVMDAARERPGELLLGGGRFGNVPSLVGVLMQRSAGVETTYTPFKGGGQAVLALLGQHVDFILEGPSEVNEHVAAGNLRIVGSSMPLKEYPGIQTFAEQGLNFRVLAQYRGVVAPPDIAGEAADFYIDLMKKTIETDDWKDYARKNELQPFWHAGDQQLQVLSEDEAEYKKLAKELNLMK